MDNSLKTVILAVLNQKKMTQNELARRLDTASSNISARMKAGSMKSKMIKSISEILEVDLLDMIKRHEQGESINSILEKPSGKPLESIDLQLTPEEVREVLLNTKRDQDELKKDFQQLIGQLKTWIQHDVQKAIRQEELINLLMEERAEYKAKKK
jgi:transcriptional regulator with XRE-family HTH domain